MGQQDLVLEEPWCLKAAFLLNMTGIASFILCHIFVYIQASFLSLKKKSQENGLFLCSDIVEKLI
jgi:hypothetical protein